MLLTSKYDFTLNSKTCTTATVADPGFSRLNFRHYPHLRPPCPPPKRSKIKVKICSQTTLVPCAPTPARSANWQ